MALPVLNTPLPTFAQSNPWLTGSQAIQGLARGIQGMQAQSLANQARQIQNQYLAPMLAQKLGIGRAQQTAAQFKAGHPMLYLPGVAGQIGAAEYYKEHPVLTKNTQGAVQSDPVMAHVGNQFLAGLRANQQLQQEKQNMPAGQQALIGAMSGAPNPTSPAQTIADHLTSGMAVSGRPLVDSVTTEPTRNLLAAGNSEQFQPHPQDSASNMILKSVGAQSKLAAAKADLTSKRAAGYNYQNLPPAQKAKVIGQMNWLGYPTMEAMNYLANGGTVQEAAAQQGIPYGQVRAAYAPTTAVQTNLQQRQMGHSELQAVGQTLNSWRSIYPKSIDGMSAGQVFDQIRGANPEDQAKFMAAVALGPEINAIRAKMMMGGRVGIGVLDELQKNTTGRLSLYRGMLSSKVQQEASRLINQQMDKMFQAAQSSQLTAAVGQPRAAEQAAQPAPQPQVSLPASFKNRAEALQWWSSATPAQRAAYKKREGLK
jgi:hypothetical protein